MNEENQWKTIKEFYYINFSIAPELVDLMASNDILIMCVSGASNNSISVILDVDMESVHEVVESVLGFDGWADDLLINPFSIYNLLLSHSGKRGFEMFKEFESMVDDNPLSIVTDDDIKTMFRICKIYSEIESLLDIEWK